MLFLDNIKLSESYETIIIDSKNEGIVTSIYKPGLNRKKKFKRMKVSNIKLEKE